MDQNETRQLLARFEEAKIARTNYDKNWAKTSKLVRGNQWEGIRKLAWWQSSPVYNKMFEFREIMRSMLADQRWGLDAMPRAHPKGTSSDDLQTKATSVNDLLDFLWDDCQLQFKLAQLFQPLFETGTGFLKVQFDPDTVRGSGVGQIDVSSVDPTYIYPDPDATCIEDAAYIIEARTVSTRYIARRWPDKVNQRDHTLSGGSPVDDPPKGVDGNYLDMDGRKVTLLECWWHDASLTEDSDEYEDDKGQIVQDFRKKYPNGRYTLMTSNGIVLEDKPNPYKHFPYIRFVEIPRPEEFWGDCTLEKVAPIQLQINDLLRLIIDNGKFLAHGEWVVDDKSGVDPKKLSKYAGPGYTIVKKQGTNVTRETGAQLPTHVFQMLQDQIDAFDKVCGLPDVLRGIVSSRQPVQTTMMQQESGEIRTRERARQVEHSLSQLGTMLVEMVKAEWTDAPRSVRVRKPGGVLDVFDISSDDLKDWEFDVVVRPGSTLPLDRMLAMQKAIDLKTQAGIEIPDSYILSLSGLPGIEAAMQAQTQEQAQQQAPAEDMQQLPPDFQNEPDIQAASPGVPGEIPQDVGGAMPIDMSGVLPQATQPGGLPMSDEERLMALLSQGQQ